MTLLCFTYYYMIIPRIIILYFKLSLGSGCEEMFENENDEARKNYLRKLCLKRSSETLNLVSKRAETVLIPEVAFKFQSTAVEGKCSFVSKYGFCKSIIYLFFIF